MQIAHTFRNRLLAAGLFAMLLASAPVPAHAASKEIIELQTQVQQLLDMVQRLQSTFDSRFSVLQHLAEQTADDANRMTATVNSLQQKINAQAEAVSGKLDTTSGQVQSLNDSVDELKSRVAKLDKSVQDMQTQLQNAQNPAADCDRTRSVQRHACPRTSRQPGASAAGNFSSRRPRLQRCKVRGRNWRVSRHSPLLPDGRHGWQCTILQIGRASAR